MVSFYSVGTAVRVSEYLDNHSSPTKKRKTNAYHAQVSMNSVSIKIDQPASCEETKPSISVLRQYKFTRTVNPMPVDRKTADEVSAVESPLTLQSSTNDACIIMEVEVSRYVHGFAVTMPIVSNIMCKSCP